MDRARARRRRAPGGALAGLLVVVALVLTACDPPFPGDDGFYRPPSPLPAGQPGDVSPTAPALGTRAK